MNDVYDQIDQTRVEATTFEFLRQNEVLAVPKRIKVREEMEGGRWLTFALQSFSDDVARQEERERDLQQRFQELCEERNELFESE